MKFRIWMSILPAVLLLPVSLLAKCPISPNGTLVVRAPAGNLRVDTSGTDSVEVEVSNRQVTLQENCSRDTVTVSASMPAGIGIPDWKIRVPRSISLDLSTQGGYLQVEDTDGREALLRTSGGKVTAGNIKGNALIMGTEVRAGNIGGKAELRGLGGRLQVGDVGGNAEFFTTGGDITTGVVRGHVKADSGSGSITIRESNGDVLVTTQEGNITSDYVHGAFDGKTESGSIRIERVGSGFHAFTGVGDIYFKLVPENPSAGLNVKAEAGLGNITMYVPKLMKATIDAIIDKPAMGAKTLFSDLPFKGVGAIKSLIPGGPNQQRAVINGGGNTVTVRTSAGTIKVLSLE
jgi:Putative adhesin